MKLKSTFSLLMQFIELRFIIPRWRYSIVALLGLATGMGLVVAHISRATSYLSDSPETCVNCHVMFPQYLTWQHSSHFNVAVCNDCHVPHESFISHYAFKARDGMRHAGIFTLRLEPQVIRASAAAIPVMEANCIRCHSQSVERMTLNLSDSVRCWDCHRDIPHGRVRSLSATSNVFSPQLPQIGNLDDWLRIGGRKPGINRGVEK